MLKNAPTSVFIILLFRREYETGFLELRNIKQERKKGSFSSSEVLSSEPLNIGTPSKFQIVSRLNMYYSFPFLKFSDLVCESVTEKCKLFFWRKLQKCVVLYNGNFFVSFFILFGCSYALVWWVPCDWEFWNIYLIYHLFSFQDNREIQRLLDMLDFCILRNVFFILFFSFFVC